MPPRIGGRKGPISKVDGLVKIRHSGEKPESEREFVGILKELDSGFRRNDEKGHFKAHFTKTVQQLGG